MKEKMIVLGFHVFSHKIKVFNRTGMKLSFLFRKLYPENYMKMKVDREVVYVAGYHLDLPMQMISFCNFSYHC